LRNWWIVFVAAAVAIGCGGGGGNGGGGTTGPVNPVPPPNVVLAQAADLQWTIVTGQGRRAPGDLVATMNELNVRNDEFDVASTTKVISATLNSYALYSVNDQFQIANGEAFKQYTLFPLTVSSVVGEDVNSNPVNWTGNPGPLREEFDADVMLARGRDTVFQVVLNDGVLPGTVDVNGDLDFDRTQFEIENYTDNLKIESRFSDFVSFDISNMAPANRPEFIRAGAPDGPADKIMFSGDAIALTQGADVLDSFMVIDPLIDPLLNQDRGMLVSPTVIGGVPNDGTYTLFEPDWSLIDPTQGIIVSLQGRWRPYTQVLSGIGSYMMLVLPNSRNNTESFTAVYIARDVNGNITDLWYGPVRFSGPNEAEIRLTRVVDALAGVEVDPAVGTISGYVAEGKTGTGTFTFPLGGVPVDFTFPLTGSFRIFRR
jgi:hypothetical protein